MKIFALFIIILFINCNTQPKFNNQKQSDSLMNSIFGKWGGPGEDSPVFEIKKDSIYYFQQATSYSYKIIDSNMIIDLPDSKGVLGNIHANGDTLFTIMDGELIKAIRF